jgi:hypothetical protein
MNYEVFITYFIVLYSKNNTDVCSSLLFNTIMDNILYVLFTYIIITRIIIIARL